MPGNNSTVRIAAVADIHCNKTSLSELHALFAQATEAADVLLLAGDLTDVGQVEEAQLLAKELTGIRIPVVAVLGNHDYEGGQQDEIKDILCEAGVSLLDGDTCEVRGIGFAGVKGFAGGFGKLALQAWGEKAIKQFVQEAVDEALHLESALARLDTEPRVVILHYAPIRATVEGEPPEVFPFLGSSRLEEPVDRFDVAAVFHGHAHGGSPEGETTKHIPVYNVSLPVLRKAFPDQPGFRVIELTVQSQPELATAAAAPSAKPGSNKPKSSPKP